MIHAMAQNKFGAQRTGEHAAAVVERRQSGRLSHQLTAPSPPVMKGAGLVGAAGAPTATVAV